MKKIIFLGMFLCTLHSFGQGFLKNLYFGLKAGGNYSNFNAADFDTEGLAGFHAGGIVGYHVSGNWAIQEEFLFSTQGATWKESIGEEELKLSYLSVPILVKYHSGMGIYLEAGPQVNLLLEDQDMPDADAFAETIDAGATFGMGYQFQEGPVKGLGIGARYYLGLTDVGAFADLGTLNSDFKNTVIQASIFYIF